MRLSECELDQSKEHSLAVSQVCRVCVEVPSPRSVSTGVTTRSGERGEITRSVFTDTCVAGIDPLATDIASQTSYRENFNWRSKYCVLNLLIYLSKPHCFLCSYQTSLCSFTGKPSTSTATPEANLVAKCLGCSRRANAIMSPGTAL